jgi:hypothetical protein
VKSAMTVQGSGTTQAQLKRHGNGSGQAGATPPG